LEISNAIIPLKRYYLHLSHHACAASMWSTKKMDGMVDGGADGGADLEVALVQKTGITSNV